MSKQKMQKKMIFKINQLNNTLLLIFSFFITECYATAAVDVAINADINAKGGNNKVESEALTVQNKAVSQPTMVMPEAVMSEAPAAIVAENTMVLHAEQWEMARSGELLLTLPVLKKLVTAWLNEKQKMIEIQYPGGEEGEFWVQELTDWLVSLGIPSNHMITTPGSGSDDMIRFNIIK
jgi:hypothetical protein